VRLGHVSTVLAALALGLAAVLYVKVDRLESALGNARAEPREGIRPAEIGRAAEWGGGVRVRGEESEPSADRGTAVHASGGGSADTKPASLEERITRLEHGQQALRTERGVPFRSMRFARNAEDLAKQLSLTSTQRTRIEDVIGRAQQRIEDVLKIPDETGKSPFERRAEARKNIEEAMKNTQPGVAGMLSIATDMISYRDRKIPGRNDTYGDEIDRIRKETREEISTALDAKQQEAFQQTNVDGLLGEAGQMSFAYVMGSDTEGGEAEMIVEMGADIHAVAPGGEEPPPEPPGSGGR
jgi:Spy/CpxP family protein refolding chaperone